MAEQTDLPVMHNVTLDICDLCLMGAGGECHTAGCTFWMTPAVSEEQAERLRFALSSRAYVREEPTQTIAVLEAMPGDSALYAKWKRQQAEPLLEQLRAKP